MLKVKKNGVLAFNAIRALGCCVAVLAMCDMAFRLVNYPHSRTVAVIGWSVAASYLFFRYRKALRINKEYPASKRFVDARYFLYMGINNVSLAAWAYLHEQDFAFDNILSAIAWLTAAFTMGLFVKYSPHLTKHMGKCL